MSTRSYGLSAAPVLLPHGAHSWLLLRCSLNSLAINIQPQESGPSSWSCTRCCNASWFSAYAAQSHVPLMLWQFLDSEKEHGSVWYWSLTPNFVSCKYYIGSIIRPVGWLLTSGFQICLNLIFQTLWTKVHTRWPAHIVVVFGGGVSFGSWLWLWQSV